MTRMGSVTEMVDRRIYIWDLPAYEAAGWHPCLTEDGDIRVLATPTGVQTYVWRPALQSTWAGQLNADFA